MLRGDGTDDEPRAEIVETSGQPISRSGAEPAEAFSGRAGGSAGGWFSRRRATTALAGGAVLLGLVVVVSQSNLLTAPGPSRSPAPVSIFPAPGSTFPPTAAGLPVVSVDAAITTDLDPASGTTELAVGGWYTAKETLEVCHPTGQPYVPCGELWTTRLLSSATPWFAADGSALPQAAGAAALQTVFVPPVRKPDLPVTNPLETHPTIAPSQLVLVGHFHDDRAAGCPSTSAQAAGCDPAFVVDAVADLTGVVRANTSNASGLTVGLRPADVVERIRGHVRPGGTILEFGPVVWFNDGINFSVVEPDPRGPPADARYVWLARGYLGGSASWLAIDDVTGRMWGPLTSTPSVIPAAGE